MKRLTYRVNIGIPEDVILTDYKSTEECLEWKNVLNQLAKYEDLEEQGFLKIFPCKVGDVVWKVNKASKKVRPHKVIKIEFEENDTSGFTMQIWFSNYNYCFFHDFGKTVFLTQAEAEEMLKGMEAGDEQRDFI